MTKKILLADDSVTIQKVIELTFMDQDYEIVAVSNGDEALERLEAERPDLLIADVHMPGASGYEVARRTKDSDSTIPVLLLVGTFEPFEESEMEASGADAHLKKPFDSQELLELVESLLEGGATAQAAEGAASEVPTAAPETSSGAAAADSAETTPGSGEELGELRLDEGGQQDDAVWGNLDLDAAEQEQVAGETELGEGEPFGEDLSLPPDDEEEAPLAGALEDEAEGDSEPFRLGDVGDAFTLEEEVTPPAPPPPPSEPPAAEPAAPSTDAGLSAGPEPSSPAETPSEQGAAEEARLDLPAAGLSEDDVDRIAQRVVDLIGEELVREVAWEVIPDLAEIAIKDRIRELESQVE